MQWLRRNLLVIIIVVAALFLVARVLRPMLG